MNIHCLWNPNHHPYQMGLSTATALLTLHEEWLAQMDKGLQNILVSLDMSVAFDTVKHEILLGKLCIYGVGENAIKLIRSYLS